MKIQTAKNNLYPIKFKPTKIPSGFILIIDTREREPLFLESLPKGLTVIRDTLKHGDYSIKGLEDKVIIERKKMSDFLGYIGKERKETYIKLEAMKNAYFSALVIETDDPFDIPIDIPTKMTPEHIRGALKAVRVEYETHVFFNKNRRTLEREILDHLTYSYEQLRKN